MARWTAGVVAGAVAILLVGCASPGAALTIDGAGVSDDQLRFLTGLEGRVVDNLVSSGRLVAEDADEALRNRVEQRAIEDIAMISLAHENEVVSYSDLDGLEEERLRENRSRAEAIEQGEIVYGLTEFDRNEFYSRELTNMRLRLVETLGGPGGPLEVSDDEIRAAYEADPDDWAAGVARYDIEVLRVPGAALRGEPCASAVGNRDLESAIAVCAAASRELSTVDGADQPPAGSPVAALLAAAQGLEIGATAEPIPFADGAALVHLLERRVDPEQALAAYRERIRAQLVEKALAAELDGRVRGAVVSVDRTRLDALTSEGTK